MRVGSAGSATRLVAFWPNQVVMLSFEIVLQKTSVASATFDQRSMRANSPSTRGRYGCTLYSAP